MHQTFSTTRLCVAALLLLLSAALAGAAGDTRYLIPLAGAQAVTIDGNLAEWGAIGQPVLIDQHHLGGGYCNDFNGEQDCSARLRMAYDQQNIYLALAVTDNSVVPLKKKSGVPGKFWEQDGMGVYLDAPACNVVTGRYNTKANRPWQAEPILQLTPSTEQWGAEVLPEGSTFACTLGKAGYTVEAAVPWASLGWQVQPGDRIFFAGILADYDQAADGKLTPLRQFLWHFQHDTVRPSSRTWAEARLMGANGFGGEFLTAAPVAVHGSPMGWKLMVDAGKPGWQVQRVALVGRTNLPLTAETPKIDTVNGTILSGEIDTKLVEPGVYTLLAQASNGKQTETVRQPVQIVDAAALLAQSKSTELPAKYFIGDPLRAGLGGIYLPHKVMTRADYLAFVKSELEAGWPSFEYHVKNKTTNLGGGWYQEYGLRFAAYAKFTGDPAWITRAQQMFEMADAGYKATNYNGLGWINAPLIYYYKQYLSAVNAWKPEYDVMVKDWVTHAFKWDGTTWRGMNNWGLSSSLRGAILNYWLGAATPNKTEWDAHEKDVWGDFLANIKDIDENTTNYAPWDLWVILNYLDMKGKTDLVRTDPQLRALFERYMLEVTPSGARPHYGSTNGWHDSPWVYLYIFERVAQITGDGRFKSQARLMWNYSVRHVEDWHQYHLCSDGAITWLTRTLAETPDNDTVIKPVPVQPVSVVTNRAKMTVLTQEQRAATKEYTHTSPERVPGKIVFRGSMSGNPDDVNSMYALIELNGEAGHCTARPTSVNCLMSNDAVLLSSQGYYEQDAQYHNMIQIEDLEGTQGVQPDMEITVPAFTDGKVAAFATTQVTNFMRWPVTLKRHFFFAKDRFLWVRDELEFKSTFFARIGPNWLSRQMNATDGKTWTNTYFDTMPYTGLGIGNGLHRWKNATYDLLSYYVPRPGMELTQSDFTSRNLFMNAPLRVRQTWRGLAKEGQTLTFDSLHIPHMVKYQQPDPAWIAGTVQQLANTEQTTAIQYLAPRRDNPQITEKVLAVFSSVPFTGGGISTDAKVALVVWQGDKVVNWSVRGATTLKVGDQVLFTSAAPADREN